MKQFDTVLSLIRPRTIRGKIIIASAGIIIIPLLITGSVTGAFLSARVESLFLERMDAELSHINNLVSEITQSAMMNLDMLCDIPAFRKIGPGSLNVYYNTKTPTQLGKVKRGPVEKEIFDFMKLMAYRHPKYVEIYAGTRYGGFVSSGDYLLRAGYDPRVRPWFRDGESAPGKDIVAKPYLSTTGFNVTAVVRSVTDSSGTILFIAGIDFSLKDLSEIMGRIKIGRTGYLVLLEKDGTILAHPRRPDLNFRNIMNLGIPEFACVLENESCLIHYNFEGIPKMAKVISSPETGWKLMAVIETSEINKTLFFFRGAVFVIILLISIFCVLLYIYIKKGIISPIGQLTEFGRSIAAGNLNSPIELKSNDELENLADDFNDMMYKLKDSIESVKAIIEMMPSIIIQLDAEGRILEWNREAQAFAGVSINEARGTMLSVLKPGIAVYLESLKTLPENGKPLSFYRIKIPGLDEQYFNLFIFILRTEHSSSFVLRIDDITELEKKDSQIRQIQKMESIGLLASGIAHDFNNILGGILATVSLLKYRIMNGKISNAADACKDLEIAEKSCETGASIASQLLNISKKEADLDLHEYDLNYIVDQIVKVCRKSFDKSIEIRDYPYKGKAKAMINSSQIQQSILNLCINASHAMTIMRMPGEPQGGQLEIGIMKVNADLFFVNSHYGSNEGNYWQIFVKDTGVGMDSSTISRIFDPFFTTKTGTSIQGTGLGLSIVYSIIKNHGGFIDVYSEVGLGSKFIIYIPALPEDEISEHTSPSEEIYKGEGTILVIDDEETISIYTEQILNECGYSVIRAGNGTEGVEIYKEKSSLIKAVILDMIMPGKSGLETLTDLININPRVNVLMTSGFHSDEIIESVTRAGASGFIMKPYTIHQISEKINSITSE